jgi:hypothetical protein
MVGTNLETPLLASVQFECLLNIGVHLGPRAWDYLLWYADGRTLDISSFRQQCRKVFSG